MLRLAAAHSVAERSSFTEFLQIAVVIPCFRVRDKLSEVIAKIPAIVQHIIIVDDGCPEGSGEVARSCNDKRVHVLHHERNKGVGAAMKTGLRYTATLDVDVVIKMDGDGQMDASRLPNLIEPILRGYAASSKGNRFWHFSALQTMPTVRRIGNLALSFLTKAASGHWNIFDPTNGYIAIRSDVLKLLDINQLSDDYFF